MQNIQIADKLNAPLKRWLSEPLLHFLVIGVALFGMYSYFNRGRGGIEQSKQIVMSLDELRIMETYFESEWHRQPTPQEFQAMVEDKVQEEVLYREGLAMGLDKDDTIVKRRMAQKMQFLAEDVATAHEPSTAELKAWFDKNQGKFALPSRYSFRHLYFSPDKRGKNAKDDAARMLAKVADQAGKLCPGDIHRRLLHVSGLLWRSHSQRRCQGVRTAVRSRYREAKTRLLARACRVRIRLASRFCGHRDSGANSGV